MKKTLFSIILLLLLTLTLGMPVSAQEPANLYVAPYLTEKDLAQIFENSTKVLDYLQGDEIEQSVTLFTATKDQFELLRSKGIRPELIEDTADISQYIYVYHPIANKASLLSAYGEVYSITPFHTLLKISDPSTFEFKGEIVQFSRMPLGQNVEKPIYTSDEEPFPTDLKNPNWERAPFSWKDLFKVLYPIIATLLLIVGVGGYLIYKRKKNASQKEQSE